MDYFHDFRSENISWNVSTNEITMAATTGGEMVIKVGFKRRKPDDFLLSKGRFETGPYILPTPESPPKRGLLKFPSLVGQASPLVIMTSTEGG